MVVILARYDEQRSVTHSLSLVQPYRLDVELASAVQVRDFEVDVTDVDVVGYGIGTRRSGPKSVEIQG